MTVDERSAASRVTKARSRLGRARALVVRALFGDRLGLIVFLGSLLFAATYWRLGVFINDNYTLANALVALADGRLAIADPAFGSLASPGTVAADGRAYGRNYGQVAVALPLLLALRAVATVADLGLLFAALWSLLVLALAIQIGRAVDRPSAGAVGGSAVALAAFFANAAVARPLSASWLPVIALQIVALLAAAWCAVGLYRLLARMHGRRAGLAAGAAAVAATPVGFWASIPKRHVVVTALALGICYAFFRSRSADTEGRLSAAGFRALAYALVGLGAWVHAPEAFVLFVALVAVDLPTAPSNDGRTLAVVALAFAASLVPFLVTNALISGNPLQAPRLLPSYGSVAVGDASSVGSSATGPSDDSGVTALLPPVLTDVVEVATTFLGLYAEGLRSLVSDPESVYRTFVRGGYISGVGAKDNNQAINLTALESAPLVAGLVGAVAPSVALVRGAVSAPDGIDLRARVRRVRERPVLATDAFVLAFAASLTLVYLPRLPLHAQVTVRYLLPVFPLCLYGLVRQAGIRRVLGRHGRLAAWTWAGGVLLGCQLLLVAVVALGFGRGEAFQLHAVLGLAAAVSLAATALASGVDERTDRITAIALGVAAALGTDLLLLSGVAYFQYGDYALPAVDAVADLLSVV